MKVGLVGTHGRLRLPNVPDSLFPFLVILIVFELMWALLTPRLYIVGLTLDAHACLVIFILYLSIKDPFQAPQIHLLWDRCPLDLLGRSLLSLWH